MATEYVSVLAARGIGFIIIIIIIIIIITFSSSSSRPGNQWRRNQYYRFVAVQNLVLNRHEFVETTKETHF
jgi:hypothetical protein